VWSLVAYAGAYSFGAFGDATCYQALLSKAAGEPQKALATAASVAAAAAVIGAPVGGVLSVWNPVYGIVFNCLTFMPLLAVLTVMPVIRQGEPEVQRAPDRQGAVGQLVWRQQALRPAVVTLGVFTFVAYQPQLLVPLAGSRLGGAWIGVLAGAWAAGVAAGALLSRRHVTDAYWRRLATLVPVAVVSFLALAGDLPGGVLLVVAVAGGASCGGVLACGPWIVSGLPEQVHAQAFGRWQVLNNGGTALGVPLAVAAGALVGGPGVWCALAATAALVLGAAVWGRGRAHDPVTADT
jgi:MFS family permease